MVDLENSLNSVNGKVHSLEHLLSRPLDSSSSWFSVSLYSLFEDESMRRIPLKEKDYSRFSLGCKFGDLLLGYGTTGKSLWHIYKDKDTKLLDDGHRPSPQREISTNIFAPFYEMNAEDEMHNTLEWLELNNVGTRLNLDLRDSKNSYGYIKIGDLDRSGELAGLTDDEIIAKISPYGKIVGYSMTIGY